MGRTQGRHFPREVHFGRSTPQFWLPFCLDFDALESQKSVLEHLQSDQRAICDDKKRSQNSGYWQECAMTALGHPPPSKRDTDFLALGEMIIDTSCTCCLSSSLEGAIAALVKHSRSLCRRNVLLVVARSRPMINRLEANLDGNNPRVELRNGVAKTRCYMNRSHSCNSTVSLCSPKSEQCH